MSSWFLPDRYCARSVDFPSEFDTREDAEGSSHWFGYVLLFIIDILQRSLTERTLGSEAVEAAMKLARQYFLELSPPQPTRHRYITRVGSWHGCTIAALAMGDFKARKHIFEPILPTNVSQVSACNPYRGLQDGETLPQYVERLAQELEAELQRLGPETVCAFVIEPICGSVSKFSMKVL